MITLILAFIAIMIVATATPARHEDCKIEPHWEATIQFNDKSEVTPEVLRWKTRKTSLEEAKSSVLKYLSGDEDSFKVRETLKTEKLLVFEIETHEWDIDDWTNKYTLIHHAHYKVEIRLVD